ncbi:glycosyltransferase involved in cell wall biosynthesis [Pontibacter ummariensis]|uniref:Glycosyltransferase involved in cell wall bisynthesis n=1 Tax=Pontibacter ummariensis TaxID=1610492 RepID=A0A239EK50_9BACT|nr:glycosyltransferase family 4 protein [Pontibacter ummariensis]PRY13309.1 glycosyltransferase involved in cell wall biosynthesis [Pontibacter ummariensis]SNS45140.1 Glycosyltransferase involved in cell wall bisynthesis [Pontibacter ummariensis]
MAVLFRVTTVPISLKNLIVGQLPYMKEHGFKPIMLSADGPEREVAMKEQDCPHIILGLTRKITPLQDLKALWHFYKLCRRYRPAIIHSHTPKAGIIAMLGGKLAGVPIRLHTVAGLYLLETSGLRRYILEMVEKLTYACATKVYPNSSNLAEIISDSLYHNPEKLKVIGNGSSNGINTAFFSRSTLSAEKQQQLKESLRVRENDFLFVFVGRIVKDKGIQELIAAFTKLNLQHPNCKLLLVGPLEQDLDPVPEETLEQIEKNPGIISVGYQSDVRPYLALSHALAFPSYREGFPNVPMQAGCFDLPCIVTDINGCNEIIEEGENGLIIPPKATDELYEAMEKLLVDQALYARLSGKARRMIVERYEQTHLWKLLLKEYQEHLKKYETVPTLHQTAPRF